MQAVIRVVVRQLEATKRALSSTNAFSKWSFKPLKRKGKGGKAFEQSSIRNFSAKRSIKRIKSVILSETASKGVLAKRNSVKEEWRNSKTQLNDLRTRVKNWKTWKGLPFSKRKRLKRKLFKRKSLIHKLILRPIRTHFDSRRKRNSNWKPGW